MTRVLVVEDHLSTREALVDVLRLVGFDAIEAGSGREGLDRLADVGPDLMILDLGLPDLDGLEMIREVREVSDVPLLVVSGSQRTRRKADALHAGADDFIEKPFDVAELRARLQAVWRRAPRASSDDTALRYGDIEVDVLARTLTRGGREIRLTDTEWRLLDVLTASAGAVVTHRRLASVIWGSRAGQEVYPTLRVHIAALRRKLRCGDADDEVIRGESGVGYRWVVLPDRRSAEPTVLERAVALRADLARALSGADDRAVADVRARADALVEAIERLEAGR